MKIDQNPNQNIFFEKTVEKDVFDLDLKLSKQVTDTKVTNLLVTSKNLCTSSAVGTMRSFCC